MTTSQQLSPEDTYRQFLMVACGDTAGPDEAAYSRAVEWLEESPLLSESRGGAVDGTWRTRQGAIYAALALGRSDVLADHLERLGEARASDWVLERGGPLPERQPLHYVVCSRLGRLEPGIAAGLLECAERLLEVGADPDATFSSADFPGSALRPLYGACGVANSAGMAALLLDRGAEIDDGESLYHSLEFEDLACFDLLLERGVTIDGTNALNHSLDFASATATRRLLEEGADPNLQTEYNGAPMHWAISRGRAVERLQLLADAGADLRAARISDRCTPYQVAAQTAHVEAALWLEEQGAVTSLGAFERFVLACARAEVGEALEIRVRNPDLFESLEPAQVRGFLALAERGRSAALARMGAAGFPVGIADGAGQTALHWAAWHGQAETVRVLIENGAPLDPIEIEFGCTPLGWAAHGSANWPNAEGDYLRVARRLIDAGAALTVENQWGVGLVGLAGSNEEMATLLRQAGAPG